MKTTKETIINHKGTRIVKDGEDWHGLQTTNLKILGQIFQDAKPWRSSCNLTHLHFTALWAFGKQCTCNFSTVFNARGLNGDTLGQNLVKSNLKTIRDSLKLAKRTRDAWMLLIGITTPILTTSERDIISELRNVTLWSNVTLWLPHASEYV